jgi:hypothetical protein
MNWGLGYGAFWLPIIEIPLPGNSVVPDADLYFRF